MTNKYRYKQRLLVIILLLFSCIVPEPWPVSSTTDGREDESWGERKRKKKPYHERYVYAKEAKPY